MCLLNVKVSFFVDWSRICLDKLPPKVFSASGFMTRPTSVLWGPYAVTTSEEILALSIYPGLDHATVPTKHRGNAGKEKLPLQADLFNATP